MSDIVLFYAGPDFLLAEKISNILEIDTKPLSIWWDRGVRDDQWGDQVKKELANCKCAVALWSKSAAEMSRQSIMNELIEATNNKIPIVAILTDKTKLRGAAIDSKTLDVSESIEPGKLGSVIFRAISNGRHWTCKIGVHEVQLPTFVRSISSHDTLIHPINALESLYRFQEPEPFLISSFDLFTASSEETSQKYNSESLMMSNWIEQLIKTGLPGFLDSGNYEAARKGESSAARGHPFKLDRYPNNLWEQRFHQSVLKKSSLDIAFQFDSIDPTEARAWRKMAEQGDAFLRLDQSANSEIDIVPIIHVPKDKNNLPLLKHLIETTERIVKQNNPIMIAIPERELGNGIIERTQNVTNIRKCLDDSKKQISLHILGAGNPLSIALFSAAGADSFDGLEWCRTVVDHDSARLFHAQQFDVFSEQAIMSPRRHVREIISDSSERWHTKLLIHNLEFFSNWMDELRYYLKRGSIYTLLKKPLDGEHLKQICNAFPGLPI